MRVTKEIVVLTCIAALLAFTLWRFHHYLGNRKVGHDDYPVGPDAAGKCPDLEMWGFKWSVLLGISIFNAVLLAYMCSR